VHTEFRFKPVSFYDYYYTRPPPQGLNTLHFLDVQFLNSSRIQQCRGHNTEERGYLWPYLALDWDSNSQSQFSSGTRQCLGKCDGRGSQVTAFYWDFTDFSLRTEDNFTDFALFLTPRYTNTRPLSLKRISNISFCFYYLKQNYCGMSAHTDPKHNSQYFHLIEMFQHGRSEARNVMN
jgi:hypothetical protein